MLDILSGYYSGLAKPDENGGGGGRFLKYGISIDCLLGNKSTDGALVIAHEVGDLVFDGVKSIASQALMWKFYNSNIQSVSFPDLIKIHTPSACESAFKNASITDIVWNKLDELSGTDALNEAFYNTQLTSVVISATKITGRRVLQGCFAKCNKLTTVIFTSLEDVGDETSQFDNMLQGVNGCTVSFPANMRSTLEGWTSIQNGFGGTNTTILYNM